MSSTNTLYLPQEEFEQPNFKHHFPQGAVGEGDSQLDLMALENGNIMGLESDKWISLKWGKRISYTINPVEVPSPQTDFPIIIIDTYTELIGKSKDELLFASTDNLPLKHQVPEFDTVTGKFIAWIKKPLVDNSNIIYTYFDNPSAINVEDKDAVWSNNFISVQLMNQLTGNIIDSTRHGNDMAPLGSPGNIAGPTGNAKNLPSSGDGYFVAANPSLNTSDITVLAWVNPTSGVIHTIVSKWENPTDNDWLFILGFGELGLLLASENIINAGVVSINIFSRVAFTIIGTTLAMYVNGIQTHTQTITAKQASSISRLEFGSSNGSPIFGSIGGVEIIKEGKSADWIKTDYNNQRPTGNTFFTKGSVELAPTVFDRMALEIPA